jgi:hypothetical protein
MVNASVYKSIFISAVVLLLAGAGMAHAQMPWEVPATAITVGISNLAGLIAILAGIALGVAIISGAGRAVSVAVGLVFGLSVIGWAVSGGLATLFGIT